MITDFAELRRERKINTWYNTVANPLEKKLFDLVCEFSEDYFNDFRFEPNTVATDFIAVQVQNDDGEWIPEYLTPPDELEYFDQIVLEAYQYKVEPLENGVLGQVNHQEHSLTIPPEYVNDEDGKASIIHELIHIYEEVINKYPMFYHDILMISLYRYLSEKIPDLQERIIEHTNLYAGERITITGGEHDILFFLKSLELDLRCGYKLGTVCGYGRDE